MISWCGLCGKSFRDYNEHIDECEGARECVICGQGIGAFEGDTCQACINESDDIFFVVYEHGEAWVDHRLASEGWSASTNERGWTRQQVEGRGAIYGEYNNRAEAEAHAARLRKEQEK